MTDLAPAGKNGGKAPLLELARAAGAAAPPELEARGIGKRFGSLIALDDVSITVRPGTFHALLGENGAGKSTLVKCIMGYYQADRGQISVGGNPAIVRNPREAQALGIGMVYQHFTLVANMSVAENLVLCRAKLPFFVDWNREQENLVAFMARMPFQIDPTREVRSLAAGEKQKLEILKQLYLGSRIMILDEPTSVLTPGEADEVLGLLRAMTRKGEISVLMITHKFREVMSFADELTVLRRGRMGGKGRVSDLSTAQMAEMMVGRRAAASLRDPELRPPRRSASRNSRGYRQRRQGAPGAQRSLARRARRGDRRDRRRLGKRAGAARRGARGATRDRHRRSSHPRARSIRRRESR